MAARTRSGKIFESMLETALRENGYDFLVQGRVKGSLAGRSHKVDFAIRAPSQVFVSLKWQGTSGTTEEKVPFEVVRLLDLLRKAEQVVSRGSEEVTLRAERAYVVLADDGWNRHLKEWYERGGLKEFIPHEGVEILDFYAFMNRVNSKQL
ncbi:hypothetical protein Mlute_00451 [Meiothermus luteus]|jgi:hypothetical protein|uniref:PD-(D/E)XK nuclease domain-containing protein n=1 Tax=Meiothermus luteus TaxID=2026184 RepID=A0A399F2H4_9DEIN|nr:PD-(D/E)XK nuclease superfamily protein [Meiothermus luteus]RIH89042.1 hypothetical protein Mlute_00451 [Meiothermus luteus]RMH58267.1 MAG: hypothetical protein D6684_01265 [Deinococcota bacterium]